MPVLITLATISALFRDGPGTGFLDAKTLRDRIQDVFQPSAKLDAVLALVDELEQLATAYNSGLESTIKLYVQQSQRRQTRADDLIELLKPWDEHRQSTLVDIVKIRQKMRDALSDEEWTQVFG